MRGKEKKKKKRANEIWKEERKRSLEKKLKMKRKCILLKKI